MGGNGQTAVQAATALPGALWSDYAWNQKGPPPGGMVPVEILAAKTSSVRHSDCRLLPQAVCGTITGPKAPPGPPTGGPSCESWR